MVEGYYKNGRKDGLWITRNTQLRVNEEGVYIYVDDEKDGLWLEREWNEDEDRYIYEKGKYRDGHLLVIGHMKMKMVTLLARYTINIIKIRLTQ
jgi:hypothetical protein